MTTFLMAAFLTVAAALLLGVAIMVRADRIRAYDDGLADLSRCIDIERHCAQFGCSYVATRDGWCCANCGHRVKSLGGWVA